MRVYALFIVITFLAIYAWRDWFKSLCGLIVLSAVMQHEDMPRNMMDIQGLNPWNMLMVVIVLAWLVNRGREKLVWDMPHHVNVMLLIYLIVIVVGFFRAVLDQTHLWGYTTKDLISNELINTVKWVIPGLLLYDGCRSRVRLKWAYASIILLYLLLAGQAINRLPPRAAFGSGDDLQDTRIKICRGIGYSSVNLSTILSGASWAMVAGLPLAKRRRVKALIIACAFATVYAQALTGGRAGYLAWAATGLVMCIVKWRKWLLFAPVVPILIYLFLPGVVDRMFFGVGETSVTGEQTVDQYRLLSGRMLIWPHVVDKIMEAPTAGFGRLAMLRTQLQWDMGQRYGWSEAFPHPHNMYLEWLLDNGVIGTIPILMFYAVVVYLSASLFRNRQTPWFAAVGGMSLSLVLVQLIAGMASQHFYPRESTVGMWAAVMLMFRVNMERQRALEPNRPQPQAVSVVARSVPTRRGKAPMSADAANS